MSTIADYVNRKNDLAIFHGGTESGLAKIAVNLGDSEICTGAQKLAQMVAILFLTELGSDPYDLDRGTTFMISVRRGAVMHDNDVRVEFGVAAEEIVRQLRLHSPSDAPLDEILVSMTLDSFSLNQDVLVMATTLETADPQRKVILPISVPII